MTRLFSGIARRVRIVWQVIRMVTILRRVTIPRTVIIRNQDLLSNLEYH